MELIRGGVAFGLCLATRCDLTPEKLRAEGVTNFRMIELGVSSSVHRCVYEGDHGGLSHRCICGFLWV